MTNYATDTKKLPVEPKTVIWNPSPEELREMTAAMPNARTTEYDNLNVATEEDGVAQSNRLGRRQVVGQHAACPGAPAVVIDVDFIGGICQHSKRAVNLRPSVD